jgi:hypothetical protein
VYVVPWGEEKRAKICLMLSKHVFFWGLTAILNLLFFSQPQAEKIIPENFSTA